MQSGFHCKKLITCIELEHAQNQAEPENQAGLVPGPDPHQMKNFKFFFQKIKSTTMPVHHVKGQPAASTYVREKGCVKKYSNLYLNWGNSGIIHIYKFKFPAAFDCLYSSHWRLRNN